LREQKEARVATASHRLLRSQKQGRGEALTELLRALVEASQDFEGVVLVSDEGLVIATAWSSTEGDGDAQEARWDDSDIGAVAARAFEQGRQATSALQRGDLERLILLGSKGNGVIASTGQDALCVALLKPRAKIGVASFEAMRISQRIAQVLG
jgi:predicted regulator of Ras-like GTPase activity (Roadblock/LC7/MglB family)